MRQKCVVLFPLQKQLHAGRCSSAMLKSVCSFQFAVLMWLLTYVGALFNGLTLLILGEITSHQSVTSPHRPVR